MDKVIEVEGPDLHGLIHALTTKTRTPYKLRVCVEGYRVKFKVNESTWSPPLGHLDPTCSAAQRERMQGTQTELDV